MGGNLAVSLLSRNLTNFVTAKDSFIPYHDHQYKIRYCFEVDHLRNALMSLLYR